MNPMQKLRLVVARGILTLVQHAGLQVMQVSLLEGETRDEVERVQNFGFSGNPPPGSTLVAVAVGGSRDHMIVVACEHPSHSPALQSGESAMYAQFGQLLKMDKSGNVTLTCPGNFSINAQGSISQVAAGSLSIQTAGGSEIQGGLSADSLSGDVVESQGVVLQTHTHKNVVPGGGNSGEPNS